jgi:hypothetical protein
MDRRKHVGRMVAATFIGLVGLAGATASGVAGATSCPVTIPNGSPFPPGGGSFGPPPEGTPATGVPATHGDGLLWVGYLSWDGIIRVRDDYVEPDGSIELKFPWARKIVEYRTIDGALTGIFAGELEIETERLDGNTGPAEVYTNPSGVHVTSVVTFPSTGCWQVTGSTGQEALTFTFLLLTESQTTPDTAAAPPTPSVFAGVALLIVGVALGLRIHTRRIG